MSSMKRMREGDRSRIPVVSPEASVNVENVNLFIASNNVVSWNSNIGESSWNLSPRISSQILSQNVLVVDVTIISNCNGCFSAINCNLFERFKTTMRIWVNLIPLFVKTIAVSFTCTIDTCNSGSLANRNLFASTWDMLPTTTTNYSVDLIVSVDNKNSAIDTDWGPNCMPLKLSPRSIFPLHNLFISCNTNVFL